jgi:hypothetical protein
MTGFPLLRCLAAFALIAWISPATGFAQTRPNVVIAPNTPTQPGATSGDLGVTVPHVVVPQIATMSAAPMIQQAPMMMPMGGMGFGGYPMWGGQGMGVGFAFQGVASMTQAAGQYQTDIQQARILREQSRQAGIETARQRMQFEMEYEAARPTYQKERNKQLEAELTMARGDPTRNEIWSGRPLNALFRSIFSMPNPTRGPNVPLQESIVRGLNLTDRSTSGTLSLAKDEGKIAWTEALDEADFDDVRDRFSKNFAKATKAASYGEVADRMTLRELRDDLKTMNTKLEEKVSDISPSRFIEARRLLRNLNDNVRGLSDPRLAKAGNNAWRSSIRNVADLVEHCLKNGLEFGPTSAPGDEAAYTAAFFAIRSYERALQATASR